MFPLDDIEIRSTVDKSIRDEQPVGLDNTVKNAKLRLNVDLLSIEKDAEYAISIENGIDLDKLTDFSVVIIRNIKTKKEQTVISDEITLDPIVVKKWQTENLKTCGEAYNKLYSYVSGNWHVHYGASRVYIMKCAIEKALIGLTI